MINYTHHPTFGLTLHEVKDQRRVGYPDLDEQETPGWTTDSPWFWWEGRKNPRDITRLL